MAITLNSTPSNTIFNEVGNCIKWNFTMTDLGSGDISRRFGYQIKDGSGNAISAPEAFKPKLNTAFDIEVKRDILPFIKTLPPSDNTDDFALIRTENDMWIDIQIEYWEIVHDASTCLTTTENAASSGTFIVVNCASDWFYPVLKSPAAIMNRKPSVMRASRTLQDWLYTFKYAGTGTGHATLTATMYDADGGVVATKGPLTIADDMNSYSVGPGQLYSPSLGYADGVPRNIAKITITSDNGLEFSYIFDDQFNKGTTVAFQTTDGGYSALSFDIGDKRIKSEYKTISRYNPACEVWQFSEVVNGNEQISDKKSFKTLTLSRVIYDEEDDNLFQYEQFLSSGSYMVFLPWFYSSLDNRPRMLKFIPDSGELVYYKEEDYSVLTIKGKVNIPIAQPNYAT